MTSPTWTWTKCRRHFCAIFMKVSQAISWTPSWVSKLNQVSYCFVFFPIQVHVLIITTASKKQIITMHKFKQLVDYCLQKLPVSSQKPWVLTYYIHYIWCNNGFIIFSSLLFTESQEILQHNIVLVSSPSLYSSIKSTIRQSIKILQGAVLK